jgi:hypothetical protein
MPKQMPYHLRWRAARAFACTSTAANTGALRVLAKQSKPCPADAGQSIDTIGGQFMQYCINLIFVLMHHP